VRHASAFVEVFQASPNLFDLPPINVAAIVRIFIVCLLLVHVAPARSD
jgi:hypothetical protein